MKRAFAISVALLIGGVSYEVWTSLPPSLTCADLTDGGVSDPSCHPMLVRGTERFSADLAARLADAGAPLPRAGQVYAVPETLALVWDGGMYVPLLGPMGVTDNSGRVLDTVDLSGFTLRPCDALCAAPVPLRWITTGLPCAMAPVGDVAQTCLRAGVLLDGGAAYVGAGTVFPASEAIGSGCVQVPIGCSAAGVGVRPGESEAQL